MQPNKAQRKTSKNSGQVKETAPEKVVAVEASAKKSTTKSSKPKSEVIAKTPVKHHHHKAASPVVAELAADPIALQDVSFRPRKVTHGDVAELAHSYWVARGCAHGHAEEDWLRAERELSAHQG